MSKMCHAVESEEANVDVVHNVPTCSDSCWENCTHIKKISVPSGEMERLSTQTSPCGTPYGTPLYSRASSFSSFASCFSRFGMFFVQYSLITEIITRLSLLLFAFLA
jgi:1-phosphatidylinositol-3-phosphate 5-kinase